MSQVLVPKDLNFATHLLFTPLFISFFFFSLMEGMANGHNVVNGHKRPREKRLVKHAQFQAILGPINLSVSEAGRYSKSA